MENQTQCTATVPHKHVDKLKKISGAQPEAVG